MPLFWKPYTSDVTNFIATLKERKPGLEAEQRAGRALLWDKAIDRTAQAGYRAAQVPQRPYVYQTQNVPEQPVVKPVAPTAEVQPKTVSAPPAP